MAYDHLSEFLAVAEEAGELRRIVAEVDPVLEVAEIVQRVCQQPGGGPALLFEHVRGSPLPLVANLLGSAARIQLALGGFTPVQVAERMETLFLLPEVPENWLQRLKQVPRGPQQGPWPAQLVKTGLSQQVVKLGRDVQLLDLPALQHWPQDVGRLLGGGQVVSQHPVTGTRHYESFPVEIRDRNSLILHWHQLHAAYQAGLAHGRTGTQMPLAIAWGGDPALQLLPWCPRPANLDPLLFAGFLRSAPVELVRGRQVALEVPAQAELVLEGYVDLTTSDDPGTAGEAPTTARMQVTAITHRGNPICVTMLTDAHPGEETAISLAAERLALPLLRQLIPEIVDWHTPAACGGTAWGLVSIRKTLPQQSRRVLHALWGSPLTCLTKILVVMDEEIDLRHPEAVWQAIGANVHPQRDVVLTEGPAAPGDYATPIRGQGSKLGLDATRKSALDGHPRPWPAQQVRPAEILHRVTARWPEFRLDWP